MDQVPYQRATLAPAEPTRTEFTSVATLESSDQVDFAVCDFAANQTLDVFPSDWPDGSYLTVVLKDAGSTVTFMDHEDASADTNSNIEFPPNCGIPTLSDPAERIVFRWNKADLLWRFEYTNVQYLYDSGWVTSWGDNGLGPQDSGGVVMTDQVDRGVPFKTLQVLYRPSSASNFIYHLPLQSDMEHYHGQVTNSTGIDTFYDISTNTLYVRTKDYAYYTEVGGGTTIEAWSAGTSEIRVLIN